MTEIPTKDVEFIEEEDGRYTAKSLKHGVASFGDTKKEALEELEEAVNGYIEAKKVSVPATGDIEKLPWT